MTISFNTVSVVIPAYNAEASIGRAVKSALAQSVQPIEIIVVDDGSADRTAEVAASISPLVRVMQKVNGGPASARNLGAKVAKGYWLAFLDADDWWYPERLRAQLQMDGTGTAALIHCLADDHESGPLPGRITFEQLWSKNFIIASSVLVRRSIFESLSGFNESKELIAVEDYNLWIRIAASGNIILTCNEKLVHYSRGVGISADAEKLMKACLQNVRHLGDVLELDGAMLDRKYAEAYFEAGLKALYDRRMPSARRFLWKALTIPSIKRIAYFFVSLLPQSVLDVKRVAKRLLPGPTLRSGEAVAHELPPPRALLRAAALDSQKHIAAGNTSQARLVVTVDAEEEFDWRVPFSRDSCSVRSMRSQFIAHRIFEKYKCVPTYMVDFPVATQPEGRAPLLELLQSHMCEIGAQLHPWINPPFMENISAINSYPGNLPQELELAKLQRLTAEIDAAFRVTPRIYRAGRYGFGMHTAAILKDLGYLADSSFLPFWDVPITNGQPLRGLRSEPHWLDEDKSLFELPISAAVVGRAASLSPRLRSLMFGPQSAALGLPSLLARTGVLERIKLTPEGIKFSEAKSLVLHLLSRGQTDFVMTYHSPSLEVGNTPYVRTEKQREEFLRWLDDFLFFFTKEIGGRCASWQEVRDTHVHDRAISDTQATKHMPPAPA
jgi:glycosyltransferase involved in cell wall biosynthesis